MSIKRTINIIVLIIFILCSTSFYKFSFLGSMEKGFELMGTILIFVFILLHLVYSSQKSIKQNFSAALFFIFLSIVTSMFTVYITRDQRIIHTMIAQRALYYYLLYFLLHQMKFDTRDTEKIIIFFAFLYIGLQFLQTILYPTIIFSDRVREARGTIRIYIPGAHYIAIAFYMYLQKFLRSNKFKYLFFLLLIFSVYVMRAGRQPMAILTFVTVLFLIIDRRVQSRFFLMLLGMIGAFSIFIIFQDIFTELFLRSQRDLSKGQDYTRIKTAKYFLTDFFESPIAYITGNGMYYNRSDYGKLFSVNRTVNEISIGDIGMIGNYAIYGLFFVIGVIAICVKSLRIKIDSKYTYMKYYFLDVILSLVTGGGFAKSDFICLAVIMLYTFDVSNNQILDSVKNGKQNQKTGNVELYA